MTIDNSTDTPQQSTGAAGAAVDLGREEAADRVATWWPKDCDRYDPEPFEVSCTRAWVGAVSDLTSGRQAGQLLAACLPFVRWLTASDLPVDPATAFSDERLAAYRIETLATRPRGSQDAICSHLRRLGRALAAGPAPVVVPNEAVTPAAPEASGPTSTEVHLASQAKGRVEAVLEEFVPRQINPSRFAAVEDLVRAAARGCQPTTVATARTYLRNATYLSAWVDDQGRPLRIDVVFHPDTIEQFAVELAAAMPTGSAATIAACLRTMSRILVPEFSPDRQTVHGRAIRSTVPYSDTELASLLAWAARPHSSGRRRHLTALIYLGLTVGPHRGEQNDVRPGDVVRAKDGSIVVTLRRAAGHDGSTSARTVTALEPYGEQLEVLATAAGKAKDKWLLGGGANRRNRSSYLCADTVDRWPIALDVSRLRATYLVRLAARRLTVAELIEATGASLSVFDALLPYVAAATGEPAGPVLTVLAGEATESVLESTPDAQAGSGELDADEQQAS